MNGNPIFKSNLRSYRQHSLRPYRQQLLRSYRHPLIWWITKICKISKTLIRLTFMKNSRNTRKSKKSEKFQTKPYNATQTLLRIIRYLFWLVLVALSSIWSPRVLGFLLKSICNPPRRNFPLCSDLICLEHQNRKFPLIIQSSGKWTCRREKIFRSIKFCTSRLLWSLFVRFTLLFLKL